MGVATFLRGAEMDRLTPAQRSDLMGRVRSKHTSPEMIVRRLVHACGFRFRLHRHDLPGTPDLILPRLGKVIFVNGCFWHAHNCPHGRRIPVSNREYWLRKRRRNRMRDRRALRNLKAMGWKTLVIWECQTTRTKKLQKQVLDFLAP